MNTFFDEYKTLNIEESIMAQPSFIKIMEDGVVTEAELAEQEKRITELLRSFEKTATVEQIEMIRQLLAEISVQFAAQTLFNQQS